MNGPQDLGGRHGFGPVIPEDENLRFHAEWEKRVLGLTLAAGALGLWNIDASRHARESLPAAIYYSSSYYAIWLRGLEALLKNSGEVTDAELALGHSEAPGQQSARRLEAVAVPKVLEAGGPTDRPGPPPKFGIGDRVRMINHQPAGHTRLPGYARGHVGTIIAVHGAHVYPDTNARFEGECPTPLYTIEFTASELYGDDADPTLCVSIEAWEPYIERA